MALTIIVRSSDRDERPSITLDSPRIVIGRGEGCEVRLPDPSVSHRHASIRQRGTDYIVLDEGSTNGTFVGPVKLSPQAPRLLKSGDSLRVGKVWLEVRIDQTMPTLEPHVVTKEIALGLVAEALNAQGQAAMLTVTVVAGPDEGVTLNLTGFDKAYVIGRGSGTDLQVSDPDASRRHVELRRKGGRIVVRDLGSKNGSKLGGKAVPKGEPVDWPPAAQLYAGGNTFSYVDPLVAALEELETASDEVMEEGDTGYVPEQDAEALVEGGMPEAVQAPIEAPPEVAPRGKQRRAMSTDVLVALLALVVLVLSGLGLFWIFSTQ